jgi:hypothetical protein
MEWSNELFCDIKKQEYPVIIDKEEVKEEVKGPELSQEVSNIT